MNVKLKSPPTRHLVGSGIPDSGSASERVRWQDVCGRHVVLEEKIDGSEVSFHFDHEANLIGRERANPINLSVRGGAEKHLDAYKDWLAVRADSFFERIEDRYVVYAEWCAITHCILYDAMPDFFIEIDIQDKITGDFLSTERRSRLLEGLGIESAPVIYSGVADAQMHPMRLVGRSSFASSSPSAALNTAVFDSHAPLDAERIDSSGLAEGIYGKIEEDGVVVGRFKWIREDFIRRIVDGGRHWKAVSAISNQMSLGTSVVHEAASGL